jgi:hypothetical protein
VVRLGILPKPGPRWRQRKVTEPDDRRNAEKEKTPMKRLSVMVLALLAVGASGALAQDVRYNFAKDAKFSDYKTFKWVDVIKGSDQVNQITDNQIKAAIEAELATKGLTKNGFG